jgi:hypothetical protein
MLIPNAEKAVIDIRKLCDYCLNPEHNDGKHKARIFLSTLGMTADHAKELRQILLEVVQAHEAQLGDFTVEWQNRSATLRSGWIIERDSEINNVLSAVMSGGDKNGKEYSQIARCRSLDR